MKHWILECLTDGEDENSAWGHLATLVDMAKAYKQDNGKYPGMVAHRRYGVLKLKRDDLWKYMEMAQAGKGDAK